jgi:asparagine synthase (glutamine-hydrolysing)
MCGIAGIITPNESFINNNLLKGMADSLAHRGPDGEGFWTNKSNTVGFAHRRLAIIDLSPAGAQPMHYMDRYSIVYNGEIYNYIELRADLQKAGYRFQSASDTEVILAAFDFYRYECLQYLDGMFAFAIWDEKDQVLFCARDRFGEKPFYYYSERGTFAFGSEMKALWSIGIEKIIENKMLLNYLSLGHVQNPSNKSQTFYRDIFSLPAAHYAIYNLKNDRLSIHSYFTIDKELTRKINEPDALTIFEKLLENSVQRKLRSDVPVGASLSGGLDSSTIAYFVNKHAGRKGNGSRFNTFSAVFPGFAKDESRHISAVASYLKLNNYTVTPTADDLITDFTKLCWHQEEPFPSSSIYAQYRVYQLAAANEIKVVLDGQGADEIMGGYHKYIHWYLQEMFSRYKFSAATSEKNLFRKQQANFEWGYKNIIASLLPAHVSIALEKKEYNKIRFNPDLTSEMLANIRGREWEGIHKPVVTKLNDILHFNTTELGLEELLRFADRNSMAHGVEVRLPFLNPQLVKFIFSLPSSMKISNGFTKSILRKTMNHHLPDSIVWRKDKVGFEPPQKSWMADKLLKDFLHEAKKKLVAEKVLKPSVINSRPQSGDAHQAGNNDWRYLCAAQILGQ